MTADLDPLSYLDFRAYLEEAYRLRRERDPKFSHRFIAQQVGSSSVGWFGDILRGKRKLEGGALLALCKLFRLTGKLQEYFEELVRYGQAESMAEKDLCYRRLLRQAKLPAETLTREKYDYFSHWHHAALRELILAQGFSGDFRELQKRLRPQLPIEELKHSLELLLTLGMVVRQADGRYVAATAHVRKDTTTSALTFRNYFLDNAQLGMERLESVPAPERDFSTLTLAFDPADLETVRQEMAELRNRLKQLSDKPHNGPRVYQCLFQVFPVSE